MNRSFFGAAASGLALTLLLAGCGGGGGGSSTSSASFSGVVADGYIQGATVFLDLNGNLSQDTGEPSATTAANGSYALVASSLTSDQQAKIAANQIHLVVSVPKTAKDADDGDLTLEQAGKAGFTLMTPASQSSVISPLTTLVSNVLLKDPTASLSLAKSSVQISLGLGTSDDVMQDTGKAETPTNVNVKNMAVAVAIALGSIEEALKTGSGAATDQQRRLATLDQFNKNISKVLEVVDTASTTRPAPTAVKGAFVDITNTLKTTSGAKSAIDSTVQTTSPVSNLSNPLTLYDGNIYCPSYNPVCIPKLYRTAITQTKVIGSVYTLLGTSAWAAELTDSTTPSFKLNLSTNTWINVNHATGIEADVVLDPSQTAGTWTVTGTGEQYRRVFRQTDVGGKLGKDVVGLSGLGTTASTFDDLTFPAGSIVYYDQYVLLNDRYIAFRVFTENTPTTTTDLTSIAELMELYATGNAGGKCLEGSSMNLPACFTFNASSSTTSGTLKVYKSDGTQTLWGDGIGAYEIRTLGGNKVLVITQVPQELRALYNSATKEGLRTYVEIEGKLRYGRFFPANFVNPLPDVSFNKTAFDAILAKLGHPATPTH